MGAASREPGPRSNPVAGAGRTVPPPGGRAALVYDGSCNFCNAGAARLVRLAPPGALDLVDYNQPGALDPFPGITPEGARRAMHLVRPDGRIFRGVGAAVEAMALRGGWRRLARVYFVPGLRQLLDAVYRLVAVNRYRIMGRSEPSACVTGSCAPHQPR